MKIKALNGLVTVQVINRAQSKEVPRNLQILELKSSETSHQIESKNTNFFYDCKKYNWSQIQKMYKQAEL